MDWVKHLFGQGVVMMELIVTLMAAIVGITGGVLAGRLRPSGVVALCAGGIPAVGVVALFAFC